MITISIGALFGGLLLTTLIGLCAGVLIGAIITAVLLS